MSTPEHVRPDPGLFYGAVLGAAPSIDGGHTQPTAMLCYTVADVDAAVTLVRAASGTATEPTDRPYGRVADAVDDQGLPFALHEGQSPPFAALHSVDLRIADTGRARAFYGTVLGWRFEPDLELPGVWEVRCADGAQPRPAVRLSGGAQAAIAAPCFTVEDLDAASSAVTASGGSCAADRPGTAQCADSQGAAFVLREP